MNGIILGIEYNLLCPDCKRGNELLINKKTGTWKCRNCGNSGKYTDLLEIKKVANNQFKWEEYKNNTPEDKALKEYMQNINDKEVN